MAQTTGYKYASQHQAFSGMPHLDTPVVDENNYLTPPWYRFLINLWQRVGSGFAQLPDAQVVSGQQPGESTIVLNALTGDPVGAIPIPGSSAADQIVIEALTLLPAPVQPNQLPDFPDPLLTINTLIPPDPALPDQPALLALSISVPG